MSEKQPVRATRIRVVPLDEEGRELCEPQDVTAFIDDGQIGISEPLRFQIEGSSTSYSSLQVTDLATGETIEDD